MSPRGRRVGYLKFPKLLDRRAGAGGAEMRSWRVETRLSALREKLGRRSVFPPVEGLYSSFGRTFSVKASNVV
jgi:hypothetical protein